MNWLWAIGSITGKCSPGAQTFPSDNRDLLVRREKEVACGGDLPMRAGHLPGAGQGSRSCFLSWEPVTLSAESMAFE